MDDNKIDNNLEPPYLEIDKTYGVRCLFFYQQMYTPFGDLISQEEFVYLCKVAMNILKYQFSIVPYKSYFANMVPDAKTSEEFIEKWYKPEFVKFLKSI